MFCIHVNVLKCSFCSMLSGFSKSRFSNCCLFSKFSKPGRTSAVQMLSSPSVLYGDCQPVVSAAQMPSHLACQPQRLYAGSRRAAETSMHSQWADDRKVRAHRRLEDAEDAHDHWLIAGNAAADRHAVDAQTMHPQVSGDQLRELRQEDAKLANVCRVLGAVPRLWPRAERAERTTPPGSAARRHKRRITAKQPHQWHARGDGWLCTQCLRTVRTKRATRRLAAEECPGLAPAMALVTASPNRHLLVVADTCRGGGVLACAVCGHWASLRPRKLLQLCDGPAQRGTEGAQALRRMAKGLHPMHGGGSLVSVPLPVLHEHRLQAAAALRQHFRKRRSAVAPRARPPVERSAAEEALGERARTPNVHGCEPRGRASLGSVSAGTETAQAPTSAAAGGAPPSVAAQRMEALRARVRAREQAALAAAAG